MKRVSKWLIGIGVLAFVVSLYFNHQQAMANRQLRVDANQDVTLGLSQIYFTGKSFEQGKGSQVVLASGYEAIGRLQSAENALPDIHGIAGLVRYFEETLNTLSNNGGKPNGQIAHYEQVMVAIMQDSAIYKTDYRHMTHDQLQKAVDVVYQAMTPQERDHYYNNPSAY